MIERKESSDFQGLFPKSNGDSQVHVEAKEGTQGKTIHLKNALVSGRKNMAKWKGKKVQWSFSQETKEGTSMERGKDWSAGKRWDNGSSKVEKRGTRERIEKTGEFTVLSKPDRQDSTVGPETRVPRKW